MSTVILFVISWAVGQLLFQLGLIAFGETANWSFLVHSIVNVSIAIPCYHKLINTKKE